jgi:hypothetical protein
MTEPAAFMGGVTDETITISVSAGQYAQLEKDLEAPGRPRVTHKVAVGPFYVPGVYVVVATNRDTLGWPNSHRVTLARLAEDA